MKPLLRWPLSSFFELPCLALSRLVLPCITLLCCIANDTTAAAPSPHATVPEVSYLDHPLVEPFIDKLVTEHHFERSYIKSVLALANKDQRVLDAISRPAEKTKPWHEYRKIFLRSDRIEDGVAFWREHAEILKEVSHVYGVPPEIIVAIIGVETRFGQFMGRYRVLDALATLGFDYPKRGAFFTRQLEALFLLGREQQQDITQFYGSYAGAMGFGQFIPSSYRSFAVDHNGDGFADIWNNKHDAIASVANYFKAHGWQQGKPIANLAVAGKQLLIKQFNRIERPAQTLAQLEKQGLTLAEASSQLNKKVPVLPIKLDGEAGVEYWLGYNNFYVITRYNRSHLYAMAVFQLSDAIRQRYHESVEAGSGKEQDG